MGGASCWRSRSPGLVGALWDCWLAAQGHAHLLSLRPRMELLEALWATRGGAEPWLWPWWWETQLSAVTPHPQGLIRMQVVQAEQAKSPVPGEQRKGVGTSGPQPRPLPR